MSRTRRRPPRNIVISHVYSSDNNGDAALTSVLISDLKRQFPGARLKILKLDTVKKGDRFEGVREYPAFMNLALNKYQAPWAKLLYALYLIPATLVWAWVKRYLKLSLWLPHDLRSVADRYERADMIVAVGGGYIRSRRGLFNRMNIPLLLHPLVFGNLLGKPTVLYSQSVGPFVNGYERHLVAAVLKRMTLVLIREDKSVALLKRIGVEQNVVRAIDSGFLLQSKTTINVRQKYHISADKLLVGVTVRSWLQGEAQEKYEQAVAEALDDLIKTRDAHVIFIPQVTASKGDDDRLTSHRVYARLKQPAGATVIDERLNHHEIKAYYDGLDVLLGTRFHSVIFSLTSYVPVVAIEYEHKTSGIMRDLGLEQWVVGIEEVSAQKLTRLLHQMIEGIEDYRAALETVLPPYVQRAAEAVELVADHYYAER